MVDKILYMLHGRKKEEIKKAIRTSEEEEVRPQSEEERMLAGPEQSGTNMNRYQRSQAYVRALLLVCWGGWIVLVC